MLVLSSNAPASAPNSIASTTATRLVEPLPSPPAQGSDAARLVSVIVSTVVVTSGIPSARTTALRSPIPSASNPITRSADACPARRCTTTAITAAAASTAASSASATRKPRSDRAASRASSRPPSPAPIRKAASEMIGASTGNPPAPAIPKPSRTTFPVMLAANTWPRPRYVVASTRPAVNVRTSSARVSGWRSDAASRRNCASETVAVAGRSAVKR